MTTRYEGAAYELLEGQDRSLADLADVEQAVTVELRLLTGLAAPRDGTPRWTFGHDTQADASLAATQNDNILDLDVAQDSPITSSVTARIQDIERAQQVAFREFFAGEGRHSSSVPKITPGDANFIIRQRRQRGGLTGSPSVSCQIEKVVALVYDDDGRLTSIEIESGSNSKPLSLRANDQSIKGFGVVEQSAYSKQIADGVDEPKLRQEMSSVRRTPNARTSRGFNPLSKKVLALALVGAGTGLLNPLPVAANGKPEATSSAISVLSSSSSPNGGPKSNPTITTFSQSPEQNLAPTLTAQPIEQATAPVMQPEVIEKGDTVYGFALAYATATHQPVWPIVEDIENNSANKAIIAEDGGVRRLRVNQIIYAPVAPSSAAQASQPAEQSPITASPVQPTESAPVLIPAEGTIVNSPEQAAPVVQASQAAEQAPAITPSEQTPATEQETAMQTFAQMFQSKGSTWDGAPNAPVQNGNIILFQDSDTGEFIVGTVQSVEGDGADRVVITNSGSCPVTNIIGVGELTAINLQPLPPAPKLEPLPPAPKLEPLHPAPVATPKPIPEPTPAPAPVVHSHPSPPAATTPAPAPVATPKPTPAPASVPGSSGKINSIEQDAPTATTTPSTAPVTDPSGKINSISAGQSGASNGTATPAATPISAPSTESTSSGKITSISAGQSGASNGTATPAATPSPAPAPTPTPTPAPTATPEANSSDVSSQVYNFFIKNGATPAAAAGIAGNGQFESGNQPERLENSGYGVQTPISALPASQVNDPNVGWGIFQESPAAKLVNWATKAGLDPNAVTTQCQYVLEDIQGSGLLQELNTAPSAQAAALIFEKRFEVPAHIPATAAEREQDALTIYKAQNP